MTKSCSRCKKEKELSEFYNNIHSPDGKQTICIACCKIYNKRGNKHKVVRRVETYKPVFKCSCGIGYVNKTFIVDGTCSICREDKALDKDIKKILKGDKKKPRKIIFKGFLKVCPCGKEFKSPRRTQKHHNRKCFLKRLKITTWSKKFKKCKDCVGTKIPHQARGRCRACYSLNRIKERKLKQASP